MGVLDRVGYVRSNYASLAPGNSPDQTFGNTPSVFGGGLGGGLSFSGFGQGADVQGSVQATGILILVLLGLLVLAHKKLPLGMGG